MDDVIRQYFAVGYTNKEIRELLRSMHNYETSERSLKRTLQRLSLTRRKNRTDLLEVTSFIADEINNTGMGHGYRWMHGKCLMHGLVVSRDTIAALLPLLDPTGVELRKRKRLRRRVYYAPGPNFAWHMDGYDKIKPYGIAIHGCIDGFSRKLLWLNARFTNNDPKVVGSFFLSSVSELGGVPVTVRSDFGTENSRVRDMQIFLTRNTTNQTRQCFIYGTSTSNQRIESIWCILRKQTIQCWMNVFHAMKDIGLFSGDIVDKCVIQYCFMELVQGDLDNFRKVWNAYRIRPSRNAISPAGKPDVMFQMPHLYGKEDKIIRIPPDEVNLCLDECTFSTLYETSISDVGELCDIVCSENSWTKPSDLEEALTLYSLLRTEIRQSLNLP